MLLCIGADAHATPHPAKTRSVRARMNSACATSLTPDVGHFEAPRSARFRAEFGVAIAPFLPKQGDAGLEFFRGGPGSQGPAEVRTFGREQASIKHTVRREARPRAVSAEWLTDAGDEADFCGGTEHTVAPRDLTAIVGVEWHELERASERGEHFVGAHDISFEPA